MPLHPDKVGVDYELLTELWFVLSSLRASRRLMVPNGTPAQRRTHQRVCVLEARLRRVLGEATWWY